MEDQIAMIIYDRSDKQSVQRHINKLKRIKEDNILCPIKEEGYLLVEIKVYTRALSLYG